MWKEGLKRELLVNNRFANSSQGMGGRKFKLKNTKKFEVCSHVTPIMQLAWADTWCQLRSSRSQFLKALENGFTCSDQHFFSAPLVTTQALKPRLEKKRSSNSLEHASPWDARGRLDYGTVCLHTFTLNNSAPSETIFLVSLLTSHQTSTWTALVQMQMHF